MRTSCSIVAGALLCIVPGMRAQANPQSSGGTSTDTSYVTCGEHAAASRTLRSDTFISPNGKRRAYVQVNATVTGGQINSGPSLALCVNNSRLFVTSNDQPFELVFLQEASDIETGNSLRIVDWSADSRRLLMELAQWQYETPGVTRTPLIYEADRNVFQQPDLNHGFHKAFGIDCSLDVRVAGYTADGKIVIETQPLSPEEEEVLAIPSCSRKKSEWILNVSGETMSALPEGAKLVRNAKIEPAK